MNNDYNRQQHEARMRVDPDYRRGYERARSEFGQVDGIMRQLEARRLELGMSLDDLARAVGVSPTSVRALLTGGNIGLRTVAGLAWALDAEVRIAPRTGDD